MMQSAIPPRSLFCHSNDAELLKSLVKANSETARLPLYNVYSIFNGIVANDLRSAFVNVERCGFIVVAEAP